MSNPEPDIAFGGNGGGELLVFDANGAVFKLPCIAMESRYARRIAENFVELVNRMDF